MVLADLRVGMILHFFDTECQPQKNKYCIIVGLSEDIYNVCTVYINSDINPNFIDSPELQALQYLLEYPNGQIPFLNRNSYIDCAWYKHRIGTALVRDFNNSRIQEVAYLNEPHLSDVLQLIRNSETMPSYYLNLYNLQPDDPPVE